MKLGAFAAVPHRKEARTVTIVVALVGILAVLAACGSGSGPSTPTVTAATGGTTPATTSNLIAVAEQTFPYVPQYGYYAVCGIDGNYSSCPFTSRLRDYLTQAQVSLCRCQNPSPTRTITAEVTASGGIAHVDAIFDLVIVSADGSLLVDDELCAGGDPSTSIYRLTNETGTVC